MNEEKKTVCLFVNAESEGIYYIYFENLMYKRTPDIQKCVRVSGGIITPRVLEELAEEMERENCELVELRVETCLYSYDFLEHEIFKTLKQLYLFDAIHLKDLKFLRGIPRISVLSITGARELDLSGLISKLEEQEKESLEEEEDFWEHRCIESLRLRDCGLSDLSSFSHLKRKIDEIHLTYNEIEDIRPIAHLVKCRAFLRHNKIRRGFAELFREMDYPIDINLRHNLIDDEELLRCLAMSPKNSFIHLHLHHNKIKDYSPLKDLTGITDIRDEELEARSLIEFTEEELKELYRNMKIDEDDFLGGGLTLEE